MKPARNRITWRVQHFPGADNPDVVLLKNAFFQKTSILTCLAYTILSLTMILNNSQMNEKDNATLGFMLPISCYLLVIVLFMTPMCPCLSITLLPITLLQQMVLFALAGQSEKPEQPVDTTFSMPDFVVHLCVTVGLLNNLPMNWGASVLRIIFLMLTVFFE